MNWLNNLAQSNRQTDISHDWVIAIQVFRIEEVPRGFGNKRKLDEDNIDECQFPVTVEVCQNETAKTDIESYMSTSQGSSIFNVSHILDVQHEIEKEDEEYRLFGAPSVHQHPVQSLEMMMNMMKWTTMPVHCLSLYSM